MRRLSPIDMAFLLAERRHQPLHVGALSLYKPPEEAGSDFVGQLAAHLRRSTAATAPFDRRVHSRWGVKHWVQADDFDLHQHFVHISLPKPGRIRELLGMVSRIHSAHLDRAYPLWRTYLIEGLEDGRIATYSKMHHSMVDGVAGIRLMLSAMARDQQQSMHMPAHWELRGLRTRGSSTPQLALSAAASMTRLLRSGAHSTPAVLGHIRQAVADYRAHHPHLVTSFQAPRCILNSKITGSRRFAAQSYSMLRIKAIARACGATSNDVMLALCGAALRRYLSDMGALPERPLIAGVPVSIRRNKGLEGNEIAFALANLGTDHDDPLKRLQAVKGSMDYTKALLQGMSPTQIMAYTAVMLAPGLSTLMPGMRQQHAVANVVISHVRGPQQTMYWQGCELDGMYPASLVLDGFALNITLISRHNQFDVGIMACRQSLPGVQRLLGYLDDAIAELEVALGWQVDDQGKRPLLRLVTAA